MSGSRFGGLSVGVIARARNVAFGIELVAVAVTMYANIAGAPKTVAGVLLAAVAPGFLGLAVVAWHQGHVVLTGWVGWVFTAGLVGVAGMCAVVSFSHIEDLALANGQSPQAAKLLAFIIDGTAALMSFLVLTCNQKLAEIKTASELVDGPLVPVPAVEVSSVPVVGSGVKSLPSPSVGAKRSTASKPSGSKKSKSSGSESSGSGKSKLDVVALADALAGDPSVTAQVLAERFGVAVRTIQRSDPWKGRKSLVSDGVAV